MENRFGVKDFFIVALLVGVIVLVVLSMVQFDRQYDRVRQVQSKLDEHTTDLARIRKVLEQGAFSIGPGQQGGGTHRTAEVLGEGWVQPKADAFTNSRRMAAMPDYAPGDALVDTFGVVPSKLTPMVSTDLYAYYVQAAVLDTLCERDPDTLGWVGRLAYAWKIHPDQKTFEFKLRPGVTFSDGEPLTAEDVVYTWELAMNEKIEAPRQRVYYERIEKVEALDDYTVRFVFKEPYFKSFEIAALVQVQSKKFYSKFTPTEYNRALGLLLGSGPYRLADPQSWRPEPGKPVELVRNERYWGDVAPAFNRFAWRVIEQPAPRLTAFKNREIDMYTQPESEQYLSLKDNPQVQAFALDAPQTGYIYIGWNQQRDGKPTPFADKRVRQAVTMLIDRERIVRDIKRGLATVNSGPFYTLGRQSDPSIKPWPYDPERAQTLLAEAGFKKVNSVLVGPDGKEFRFRLSFNSARDERRRICTYVKDALATAGIICEPDATEWTVLLKRIHDRQIDATCMGWGGVVEEDPKQLFHSESMEGTGDNFCSYSNPELDKTIEEARTIADIDKGLPLWHKVHRIIHEDQPYTFLFQEKQLTLVDGRFKGVEPTRKLGLSSKLDWYVPAALQKYKD